MISSLKKFRKFFSPLLSASPAPHLVLVLCLGVTLPLLGKAWAISNAESEPWRSLSVLSQPKTPSIPLPEKISNTPYESSRSCLSG